jgi:hypothetical protein
MPMGALNEIAKGIMTGQRLGNDDEILTKTVLSLCPVSNRTKCYTPLKIKKEIIT